MLMALKLWMRNEYVVQELVEAAGKCHHCEFFRNGRILYVTSHVCLHVVLFDRIVASGATPLAASSCLAWRHAPVATAISAVYRRERRSEGMCCGRH